jgi:hypothetical protein
MILEMNYGTDDQKKKSENCQKIHQKKILQKLDDEENHELEEKKNEIKRYMLSFEVQEK